MHGITFPLYESIIQTSPTSMDGSIVFHQQSPAQPSKSSDSAYCWSNSPHSGSGVSLRNPREFAVRSVVVMPVDWLSTIRARSLPLGSSLQSARGLHTSTASHMSSSCTSFMTIV